VRTNLVGSKVDTSLDFQLGSQSGDWLIYDVVIDDASMVRNYQAQFHRIIRDDSYEGLVKKLRQRGVIVKVFERTTPDVALSMHTVPQ
jgi:phospholipid transport system substrate-binding protein